TLEPPVVFHGHAEHDRGDRPVGQSDRETLLTQRLWLANRDLAVLNRDLIDQILDRRALEAEHRGELRVFETLGKGVLRPLHGPEAVAAFEPEAISVGAEIRERELGLGSIGTREGGNAGRTGHCIDEPLLNAFEIPKVRMDPLALEREGLVLEEAVDAPRA